MFLRNYDISGAVRW